MTEHIFPVGSVAQHPLCSQNGILPEIYTDLNHLFPARVDNPRWVQCDVVSSYNLANNHCFYPVPNECLRELIIVAFQP